MIRTVLLLAFTSLIISMFFLVGFDEGWNVALRKLLGTAVVIVGAIILIMPSVVAWKGSNIAWKILAILFNVCGLAAGLLAVLLLSGISTLTIVNTLFFFMPSVGAGLISWGIAWVFAGLSLSTRPRPV